jgi:hypothetical protein
MAKLSSLERLNLKKLIDDNDSTNNTENIRSLRHSDLIKKDVGEMVKIKLRHIKSTTEEIADVCREKCTFLFNNYTDIFNKIINNEIDLTILKKFLGVLKLVEDGKMDQHEASVIVGKVLKELYIDSAMKVADKKDAEYQAKNPVKEKVVPMKLSWAEYKAIKK